MFRSYQISDIQGNSFLSQIDEQNKVLAFTKDGKPKYALLDWKYFEEIFETVEVLADANLMKAIERGLNDNNNKRLTTLEDVENELL